MSTLVRSTDPDTSHEAAESVSDKVRVTQGAVLACLKAIGPANDTELIVRYMDAAKRHLVPLQSASGIRTRRAELVRQGLVFDTGQRDVLRSGRRSIVWAAVKA